MKKIVSENFKSKMIKLSGVDLIAEGEKTYIQLIKENKFLTEEQLMNEGIKDMALGLLTALTLLTSTAFGSDANNSEVKNNLLNVNLKNKIQVDDFINKLNNRIKPGTENTQEYKDFIEKLKSLQQTVGTTTRNQGAVQTYTGVSVKETNLSFDLTNPENKKALEEVLLKAKKFKGSFVVSIDTLKEMVDAVAPTEEVKMNEKFKIANQSFKDYNAFKADEQIVDSIANEIINKFSGYKNITGSILVKGSASNVPTTAFGGDNEKLAQARACSLAQQLEEKLPENLQGKINVDWKVDGPEYEHDHKNIAKYQPFQFSNVDIHLAAIKSLPIINTPEKITVNVKLLMTSIASMQKIVGAIKNIGGGGGKGKASVSCPVRY